MTNGGASHSAAAKPGATRAKRRDLAALEERRIRAARLLREGVWQAEVARRVGVRRQSVSRWARKLKRGGEGALRAGRVGRPARLHREDLRRVEGQLKRGPGTLKYGKWTSARVKELIERECRVKYDASQAWRILRRMGWSFYRGGRKAGASGWQRGEVRLQRPHPKFRKEREI